jgi:hypothetical protein
MHRFFGLCVATVAALSLFSAGANACHRHHRHHGHGCGTSCCAPVTPCCQPVAAPCGCSASVDPVATSTVVARPEIRTLSQVAMNTPAK